MSDGMTVAPGPFSQEIHLKKAVLLGWQEGTTFVSDNLLREARLLEIVRKDPHPGVVGYHGCVLDPATGRITALALQRLGSTLYHAKERGDIEDAQACLAGIRSGIEHLHRLGIVHNDLTPLNVMLDSTGSPVIIDFDTASAIGQPIGKGATPGWTRPDVKIGSADNDWYSFALLQKFLE